MNASDFGRRSPVYSDRGLNAAQRQAIRDLPSQPTSRCIHGMDTMRVVDHLHTKRPERPAPERSQHQRRLGKAERSIAWVQRIDFGLRETDALDIAYQAHGARGACRWPNLIDRILPASAPDMRPAVLLEKKDDRVFE